MLFMGHTCFKNQTRHRALPSFALSFPFACPYSLPPFAQTPFPPFFLFDYLPFSVLRNGMFRRCSFPLFLSVSHSSPSSAHESPPKAAGNVSRILQNVSRLSYCFRFLLTDETTNARMDWIFDGADPSGPSTHTLQSTYPPLSFASTVLGYTRASSANCVKASRRLPLSISISSSTRYDFEQSWKGCI